jgi:LytR cell envelope-related transcriptional attenuator
VDTPIHQLELVRPWRTATLVAAGIAAVELALLVVAGLILVGRSIAPHAHSAAAATPKAVRHVAAAPKPHLAPLIAHLPRSKVGVIILNGNGIHGAAASAAALVSARGYVVKQVGNANNTGYPAWRLMYGPGFAGEAKRFVRDLGMSAATFGPLDGMKPARLRGAQLVLILGATKR